MPVSNQMSAGTNKAAKFVAANPLAPLADPFSGMGDDEKELHKAVSNSVQTRLETAMQELQQKHRDGTNEIDDGERAPTGAAYRELHRRQQFMAREEKKQHAELEERQRREENRKVGELKEHMRRMKFQQNDGDEGGNENENENNDDSDSEEDYDHLLDECETDPTLLQIRQSRLAELRQLQSTRAEHLSLGHGQYRTITQDEFLPECTGKSKHVAVHFFHNEFERCKIMDFHLKSIAEEFVECKFVRMDAEKAPFFVAKLKVKTLPTLLVFEEGKEVGRLTGFEGLAMDATKPDEWHTGRLKEWLADKGAIRYERPSWEVEKERRRLGVVNKGAVWSDRERSGVVEEFY
mmetsp:Transcript_21664/g.45573  ORF Transcript_21664/g.45573 Transcript_21664/m.45573 type:complete len:350 (+) Transcript_21664:178-1227(+)|eukprot:CAMPEP_0171348698 /NCGR_PEP_ID=MMETSP0878-20121228/31663_1 /TAXON_ID=67004 /ORGANISM="Thalassiosira weissflogii, Strain CCMP1336" /LENGTH=349 /DNA_ID=CAMNT_0011853131 /DNA_START=75 /DNA_END=1124 /DNA_ORIENTATION=+